MANCIPLCEHVRFSVTQASELYNFGRCKADFTLTTSNFKYILYLEQFEWTFWSFTAQLGGILSFWLGLDAVIFMEWLIKFTKWILTAIHSIIKKFTAPNEN